jgi:hypothetical protein
MQELLKKVKGLYDNFRNRVMTPILMFGAMLLLSAKNFETATQVHQHGRYSCL